MNTIHFTYLSREDVVDINLTMAETISIIEGSFREHGQQQFENPPKPGIHPRSDAFIHAMPAYLPEKPAAGLKWISSFSHNYRYGVPTVMGLMILNDVTTGQPLAVMDASWLTAMRTAAASAVAVKYLVRKGAEVVGIVGAGAQGFTHGLAMMEVLPGLKSIKMFDVNTEILNRCIAALDKYEGFQVMPVGSAQQAIQHADVVVTATSKLTRPIFKHQWIQPGALILPVHTRGWDRATPGQMDKFIVDFWEQFQKAQETEGGYYKSLPPLYAELGEIVAGKKPGRENDLERIMDHNYGMAIHDVALADAIFSRSKEKRIGTLLPLMDREAGFF